MENEMINIHAGQLTYGALIELLHGNHVTQKHIIADFYNGGTTADKALIQLKEVRDNGEELISTWVRSKERSANERIF